MKRTLLIALALLTVGLLAATVSAQQATVLRLAHTGGPGSIYDVTATKFAATVNESLKGRVEIRVSGASQLGSDEQVIRGIKIGAPEMSIMSTVIETVEKPADLKGLKLRVPSGVWRVKMFKAYGASPQPMPMVEVFKAIQAGSIDGQENPLNQIASQRFQEIQKYLSLTGHVYSPAVLLISEETWKKLPKDIQDPFAKITRDMDDFSRAEGERLDRELLKKLAPPMQVNNVNKDAFIQASTAIYEDFGQQVAGGRELISLIQSLR